MLGETARIEVGSSGEFSVWVDGTKVAEKAGRQFPEPAAIIAAIQALPGAVR